jgi:hypothetical protein
MSYSENSSESENDLCEAVNNLNLSTTVKGKITETNQRKPKLVALGYQYRVSGRIVDGRSINWRCCFKKCRGSVTTLGAEIGREYDVKIKNDSHIYESLSLILKY